jgi:hypothetical protein
VKQGVERGSHQQLGDSLDNEMRPEELLAQRLMITRMMKDNLDKQEVEKKDFQALARKLLKDEKFIESLRGKFSPEDIERLLGQVSGTGGIGNDPELRRLLKEGLQGKTLGEADKEMLRRWRDKLGEKASNDRPIGKANQENRPPVNSPRPPQPPPSANRPPNRPDANPWRRFDNKQTDWFQKNVDKWTGDVHKWLDTESGKNWIGDLKDFANRVENRNLANSAMAERARGLSKYLPRLSDVLPNRPPPRIPDTRLPRLPSLGGLSSGPRMPGTTSATDSGKVLLWILVFGVVVFVLFRVGGTWAERRRQAQAASWRLGPWPVRPEEVSTRGDLVRAFEYLAQLCLGQSARTCHHLDLASQIARQPALDPDRRREAAIELARIYEQARYTPDEERLPDEDLRRARRELTYLAGVSTA